MEDRVSFNSHAKALLLLVSACAFLAIFSTFDTSEHYRAWRTARKWTTEQKSVAPAKDANLMHAFILVALAADTAVIALSFACGLMMGISVTTESAGSFAVAKGLGWASIVLGLAFSAIMIAYEIKVGPRQVLKGPIFDYNLSMQLPIALAVGGYPISFILYGWFRIRKRRDK
jgi:hypothetical protein